MVSRPSSPHPSTAISTDEIVVPGFINLDPGTAAGKTNEGNVAPDIEMHHDGAEKSAPKIEEIPEAGNLGEEEVTTKISDEATAKTSDEIDQQKQ